MPPKEKVTTEGKRKKIVRACKDCRRRKVKCDGETPCSTCKRSSIQCIFETSTPKRGANKQYIESLENRIQVMEKAIHSLGGMHLIEEAVRRQHLLDENPVAIKAEESENRFLMNEMGSPYYIQDIMSSTTGDSQSSRCSSPKSTTGRQDELVNFFLVQIQPSFSLFLPDYFNQLYSAHEIPAILINAMCALSLVYQLSSEEEKNHYYHKAVQMLDEWVGRPSIEMIQTLLILVKYTENNQEGYFERSKSLLSRAIELCKILELDRMIYHPETGSETERRVFYMVLRYHVLLCVEQNIELELFISKDSIPPPNDDTQRIFFHFSVTLLHIYHHLRRITKRQDVQIDQRNDQQIVQETLSVMQLQYMIDEDMLRLPAHLLLHQPNQFDFPADELPPSLPLTTRLVYIHHHLNLLLLHFHYARHPLPQGSTEVVQYPHHDIALSSASAMVRLVESFLLDPNPMYRFIPRGLQWLTYCSALAFSVLQLEMIHNPPYEEYQRALELTQRISRMSPYNEMKSFARELDTSCHSSPVIQPMLNKRRNTISERPMPIPSSLLQLSSTDLSSLSIGHQPLHNMHAAPLQLNKRTLRTTSHSCADLRSMQQIHQNFSRKPSSIITTSTSSTLGPYRHTSPTKQSYSKPYDFQSLPRQQQKIRKSSSHHGLSNQYSTYPNVLPSVDFRPFHTMDSNELAEGQFPLDSTEFDFFNPMLNDERTEGHALL